MVDPDGDGEPDLIALYPLDGCGPEDAFGGHDGAVVGAPAPEPDRDETANAACRFAAADHVEVPNLAEVVKELMETQHKAVLKRLVNRGFDEIILERLGADALADATETHAQSKPSQTEPVKGVESSASEPLAEESARSFGEGIVSDKPLDEVILNYLVENARNKRKRSSGS